MTSNGPDPKSRHPFEGLNFFQWADVKGTVFLKNVITRPNIIAGDFSYYNDFRDAAGAENFENSNVLYHYPFSNLNSTMKCTK